MIDLDEISKEGQWDMNMEVKGGDVVYVPEAGRVYVDNAVKKPGNNPINTTMSVQEAITADGGCTRREKGIGQGRCP